MGLVTDVLADFESMEKLKAAWCAAQASKAAREKAWAPGDTVEAILPDPRRFTAAVAAMQGLLSAWAANDVEQPADIAHDAVAFADALLAELDRR